MCQHAISLCNSVENFERMLGYCQTTHQHVLGNCYITLIHARVWFQPIIWVLSRILDFRARSCTQYFRFKFFYSNILTQSSNISKLYGIDFFFVKFNLSPVLCLNFSPHRKPNFSHECSNLSKLFKFDRIEYFIWTRSNLMAMYKSNHNVGCSFTFFFSENFSRFA